MIDIYRLVYVSRNRIDGSPDEVEHDVARILKASRANNAACGITGAMCFSAGWFAQALEGPRMAVEQTYARIKADPRHDELSVLQEDCASGRSFPDWFMAYTGDPAHPAAQRLALLAMDGHFRLPSDAAGLAIFQLLCLHANRAPLPGGSAEPASSRAAHHSVSTRAITASPTASQAT